MMKEILIENEVYYIHAPTDSWYYEMKYFLTHGSAPQYLEPRKRRALRLKYAQYQAYQWNSFLEEIMIMFC
jgi:hypothetical protein